VAAVEDPGSTAARPGSLSRSRPDMTVGEWWACWFRRLTCDLAPSTLEAYAQQYRRHVGPRFGRARLGEVTALGLSQFTSSLREQGLAPSSQAGTVRTQRERARAGNCNSGSTTPSIDPCNRRLLSVVIVGRN